jgi:hypothetical protein
VCVCVCVCVCVGALSAHQQACKLQVETAFWIVRPAPLGAEHAIVQPEAEGEHMRRSAGLV